MDSNGNAQPESDGGAEGGNRAESGLTKLHDARLESLAVRRGWIKGRWPTGVPKGELIEQIKGKGDVTLAERTALAAFELLEGSERAKGIGGRIVVAMEKQNQKDDHHADGKTVHHEHRLTVDDERSRLAALAERIEADGMVIDAEPAKSGNGRPATEPSQNGNGAAH